MLQNLEFIKLKKVKLSNRNLKRNLRKNQLQFLHHQARKKNCNNHLQTKILQVIKKKCKTISQQHKNKIKRKITCQGIDYDYICRQKYPTPDDEDGACAFYKSLFEKNPKSEMARKYCLEYGVLELAEASKIFKESQKTKK